MNYENIASFISGLNPRHPTYLFYPSKIEQNIHLFNSFFPNNFLYAIKTNSHLDILTTIYNYGIRKYDVASIQEIETISKFKDVDLYYMNPNKDEEDIYDAYHKYGVRSFSLDCLDEFHKILKVLNNPKDLNLFLRIHIEHTSSYFNLSTKFGANQYQALKIIKEYKKYNVPLNICFHVGSQCESPNDFYQAIQSIHTLLKNIDLKLEVLDIGGGFPSEVYGKKIPNIIEYFNVIKIAADNFFPDTTIIMEPGRAIVANSCHLIAKIIQCQNQIITLNTGIYNGLMDSNKNINLRYKHRCLRLWDQVLCEKYGLQGPTCCSEDVMPGPYYFPNNIKTNDYIIFEDAGAYSLCLNTDFNGLGKYNFINMEEK